jgi:hypothetical protein
LQFIGYAGFVRATIVRDFRTDEVTKINFASSAVDRGGLASILAVGLRCAAMTTGTALRHTRIGDPALL